MTMYRQYLQINSPDEVNVSSTTRDVLEKQLNLWFPQSMIISRSKTKNGLEIGEIYSYWWCLLGHITIGGAKKISFYVYTYHLNPSSLFNDINDVYLNTDSKNRIKVFEGAYREILSLLYQNLWTLFRIEEAHESLIGMYIFEYLSLFMCVYYV